MNRVPPLEPPEPYFAYEVETPPQRVAHLRLRVQATEAGVCLSWEGDAEGTALGPLDAAGAVLLHAIGGLLSHPQPGLPDDDTAPRAQPTAGLPQHLLRPAP